MRTFLELFLALVLTAVPLSAAAQTPSPEQRDLRERIEARYDVVPLSDGIALRPKSRERGVRLIEVSDGGILIDGDPVTGRELRERVGADADLIVRLSYLDDAARGALFGAVPRRTDTEERQAPSDRPEPPEPAPVPDVPGPPESPEDPTRSRVSHGDRVRILGGVTVERDERIHGQAVAVMGSVRIDGEVTDQVVAVMGSVTLGPEAVVGGDIVSVGGRVNRAPGARVRGAVTEVAMGGRGSDLELPGMAFSPFAIFFGPFGGMARLIGSTFHLLVLALFASMAFLVARVTVERSAERVNQEPLKATVVGIVSQILIIPAFVLVAIVLAVTIIGIPLLLLLPFAALFLLLLALAGFSGTALSIGRLARRRFSSSTEGRFVDLLLGVVIILLPLLLGRVVGLVGWPASPIAFLLVAAGLGLEYLAWATGFGAVLINAFTRWQARRGSPPAPESATV